MNFILEQLEIIIPYNMLLERIIEQAVGILIPLSPNNVLHVRSQISNLSYPKYLNFDINLETVMSQTVTLKS